MAHNHCHWKFADDNTLTPQAWVVSIHKPPLTLIIGYTCTYMQKKKTLKYIYILHTCICTIQHNVALKFMVLRMYIHILINGVLESNQASPGLWVCKIKEQTEHQKQRHAGPTLPNSNVNNSLPHHD